MEEPAPTLHDDDFAVPQHIACGTAARASPAARRSIRRSGTIDDIAKLLKIGMTPEGGFVAAPMSEVVDAGTAKLTESDRRAIAVYLKSLPRQPGKGG